MGIYSNLDVVIQQRTKTKKEYKEVTNRIQRHFDDNTEIRESDQAIIDEWLESEKEW